MNVDFTNQTVVITGAASGIGFATARVFLEAGANLYMTDIDENALAAAATRLSQGSHQPSTRTCDVRSPEQVDALIEAVVDESGRLDAMVNNVGVTHFAPIVATETQPWLDTVSVTLHSCFYGLRAALRPMLEQGSGAIVNISSGAGVLAVPFQASYGAAKAGVINLTKTAAIENGASGVRINCVVPGPIDTPGIRRWMDTLPHRGADYEAAQVAGRLGRPEEIANAVVFLASSQASYINGTTLVVDGGVSAKLATGL